MFTFLKIPLLTDNEIDLVLEKTLDEDVVKAYVPSYHFSIKKHGETTKIGHIDIRIGFNKNIHYGGNIGYHIYEPYRGHHYAAKACKLIKEVALAHEMTTLRITTSVDNIASIKTIESLDADFLGIVDLPEDNEMYQLGERQKRLYDWKL